MSEWVIEVSQLNAYVSKMFGQDPMLRSLRLRGEISGFNAYPSGHWYFTLKDATCQIKCVMFRTNAMRMSFRPQNGTRVVLHGAVKLYEEGGSYQFVADAMRPEGKGDLWQQFEALKTKLEQEGLFAPERKKPLPYRPKKIAIITSQAGAVLHDICRVAGQRDPSIPLVLLPTAVQGIGAGEQIAAAIARAARLSQVDLVIVGRGGGSMEDLWCFNEECVARAIAACPIPVISAVGHETDFTIADFVADRRAATPSNAAEIAVPDRMELVNLLRMKRTQLHQLANRACDRAQIRLMGIKKQLDDVHPEKKLYAIEQKMLILRTRLDQLIDHRMTDYAPKLAMASIRLDQAVVARFEATAYRLKTLEAKLKAISPKRVLERGYVLVTDEHGAVTSASTTADRMTLHFADGQVAVRRESEDLYGNDKEKAHL